MTRPLLLGAAILAAVLSSPACAVRAANEFDTTVARLGGLDKVTARISEFDVPVGGARRFGALQIAVSRCLKRPPEEPPENAAFLVVTDAKADSNRAEIFRGWMFASSPSLSALEHPVYDVWVIECRKPATSSAPSSTGNDAERDNAWPSSR